ERNGRIDRCAHESMINLWVQIEGRKRPVRIGLIARPLVSSRPKPAARWVAQLRVSIDFGVHMAVPLVVPELDVSDLSVSLGFYVETLGFSVLYDRPEEKFAYLDLDGAQLMLEEATGPGRRFHQAPLEFPFGRGINLQIQVADVDHVYARVKACGLVLAVDMEDQWYRREQTELGNRQFVVADPDGYLLRLFSQLGERNLSD
ncbi:MAG: VOC family protein, partial [Burkholderiaceae bacterium]